jgi:hypothetical protein
VSYLRLTPADYHAIRLACRHLGPGPRRPGPLRRRLAAALTSSHPDLAAWVRGLGIQAMVVLCEHLRPQPPARGACLTAVELRVLSDAFGPLLCRARFRAPLRRAVVRLLRVDRPGIAAKVEAMSEEQFAELCERVRRTPNVGG